MNYGQIPSNEFSAWVALKTFLFIIIIIIVVVIIIIIIIIIISIITAVWEISQKELTYFSSRSWRHFNIKAKVKLSLCFNWAPRHEGVLGMRRYSSTHSLTSALDGREWSASHPGSFTPRERAPGTHWIGGWVDPKAGLDAVMKR
jgi:hypothetical protein